MTDIDATRSCPTSGTTALTGLVLAAGRGRRFGSNKLLEPLDGALLVSHCLKAALASKLRTIKVVVGPGRDPVRTLLSEVFADEDRLEFVENPKPELGMISSLQAGLRDFSTSSTGALLLLGDMPWVNSAVIDRLVDSFEDGRIIVATVGERWTHPRILPKDLFSEFLSLDGEDSGKFVLERHTRRILRVPFAEEALFRDVDRPADLPRNSP